MDRLNNIISFFLLRRLSRRQRLFVLSVLTGIIAGFAAALLKSFVHFLNNYFMDWKLVNSNPGLILLLPPLGILATVWITKAWFNGTLHRGSAYLRYYMARHRSAIPKAETFSHLLTSGLTVGSGGSAGLESPMLHTGSAIGSALGQLPTISSRERTILLACGGAAGISAAFNAPVAGVLFVIEVLLTEVSVSAFVPIIVSSATGSLISNLLLADGILLRFPEQSDFHFINVPAYLLLGLLTGVGALYYNWVSHSIELKLAYGKSIWFRFVFGAILLVGLMFFCPPLFGEGYGLINALSFGGSSVLRGYPVIMNDLPLPFLLILIVVLKPVAVGVTFGLGGNGGNFGPSLVMGSTIGYVYSNFMLKIGYDLPISNFTLVAMAGMVSGVLFAPMTAIFLIAEITGGYSLMIPLMIVSSISILMVRYYQPVSWESQKLTELLAIDRDSRESFLLSRIELENIIEKDFSIFTVDASLNDLIESMKTGRRNLFPILEKDGSVVGVVHMDDIRQKIFDPDTDKTVSVTRFMRGVVSIDWNDSMEKVMQKFNDGDHWSLPVVKAGVYVGCVSKANLLDAYKREHIRSV